MVLTNDDSLADYLRSLRAHGWVRNDEHNTFEKSGNPFEDSFRFVLPGFCVRPLEMSGATGQEQLKKWPQMLVQRRKNARIAQEVFANESHIFLQEEHRASSWFGFGLILTGTLESKRKEVIAMLTAAGVECRPIVAGNFMKNPVIELMDCEVVAAPAADYIDTNGFFIGNDCIDLEEEIRQVAALIKEMA